MNAARLQMRSALVHDFAGAVLAGQPGRFVAAPAHGRLMTAADVLRDQLTDDATLADVLRLLGASAAAGDARALLLLSRMAYRHAEFNVDDALDAAEGVQA